MKNAIHYRSSFYLVIFIFLNIILTGCVASGNYYSARTLDSGKFALGLGADDIMLKTNSKSGDNVSITKGLAFAPSFGFACGLPLKFETGLRWYPLTFFEASLRKQINPDSFKLFDGSVDLSYAGLLGAYAYFKAGASISKNIKEVEPFVHYYFYQSTGKVNGNIYSVSGVIDNISNELINNTRVIGFGVGIPFRKVKFFPEFDYQYFHNDLSIGIWHFGIGMRIYTN